MRGATVSIATKAASAVAGRSCYTPGMRYRLGPLVAGVLLLGCTSASNVPGPSTPTQDEGAASSAPADAPTDGDAAAPPVSNGTTTQAGQTEAAGAEAPERVETDVNDDYVKQTNPKRWAAQFEREGREVSDRQAEILAALDLRAGMAVADVGAGTGLFTLALAERVGPKGQVYAVDVQAYFLDHIGQKALEAKLDNVTLVRADQASAKLPEGSVDLVLLCDSYHHVEQPAAYLASLKAALRPGGRLVIVDYIAIEGKSEAWMLDHVRATPTEFRAEIESAGFRFLRAHEGVLEENFFFEFERP
jgi:predicted methyltransferase